MSLLSKIKHEGKEVGLVTLYFFFCFGVILTLKKLLLAGYQVDVEIVSTAAISALIIAKIVIILDHTPAGNRFDAHQPLWVVVIYKTLVYLGIAFIVFYLEKLFHAYRQTGLFNQAVSDVWKQKDWNVMLMKLLCFGLTFLAYHLFAGLDRRLCEGALRRKIFERPAPSHGPSSEG